MGILLESVTFGEENPGSPFAPLSLARGQNPRPLATWTRGTSVGPEDCPITIIASLVPDRPALTVAPRFRRTAGERVMFWSMECLSDSSSTTKFGSVLATRQDFPAMGNAIQTSGELEPATYHFDRVTRRDIILRWTMRDGDTGDISTAETKHRLYVLLAPPSLPWSAAPEDSERWLWPEVLDFACQWADGAQKLDAAAKKITNAVFALGKADETKGGLRYGSNPRYTRDLHFECGLFLDHLLGLDSDSGVDCRDLSAIVSTFANATGCQLHQAQCGQGGALKAAVRLIGGTPKPAGPFSFHELVWDGSASKHDRVWDACLAFAANCPTAVGFAKYASSAFEAPTPPVLGPLYSTNRPIKPRGPQPLSDAVVRAARKVHPELPEMVEAQPARVRTFARVLQAQDLKGALRGATGKEWKAARKRYEGETAFETRVEADGLGAAELRVSVFSSAADTQRMVAAEALNIAWPLIGRPLPAADLSMGAEDGRTQVVRLGRIGITAGVAFGEFDLAAAVAKVANAVAALI